MRLLIVLSAALAVLAAAPASAQNYVVQLDGLQEVPPNASTATGSGTLSLDAAKMLSFNISYSGLSSAETGAHIHGAGGPGVNAGVQFPLPLGSPKVGSVGPLTAQQEADLNAGLYYVNVHTETFPGGEIRGQIELEQVPVEPTTWGRVKQLLLDD
jgi:hypothetical protein